MYNIDKYYIEKISYFKYPDALNKYDMTRKAFLKVLKMFRRNLSIDDILEILEHSNKNKKNITNIIKYVFSDMKYHFTDDIIIKLQPYFYRTLDLIYFVNIISGDEVFVGGDLDGKLNPKIEDLLNCRSYKIYRVING